MLLSWLSLILKDIRVEDDAYLDDPKLSAAALTAQLEAEREKFLAVARRMEKEKEDSAKQQAAAKTQEKSLEAIINNLRHQLTQKEMDLNRVFKELDAEHQKVKSTEEYAQRCDAELSRAKENSERLEMDLKTKQKDIEKMKKEIDAGKKAPNKFGGGLSMY